MAIAWRTRGEERRKAIELRFFFHFKFAVDVACYTLANSVVYACESEVAISQSTASAPVAVVAANRDFKNVHTSIIFFSPGVVDVVVVQVRTAYLCVNENSNIRTAYAYIRHNYLSFTHTNESHCFVDFCHSIYAYSVLHVRCYAQAPI